MTRFTRRLSKPHAISLPNLAVWSVLLLLFLSVWTDMSWAKERGVKASQDILLDHFPDRAHAVVWRNWHATEPELIAKVLATSVENVTAMAYSMGLPPAVAIPPEQKDRGYFWMTLCRRNWHLLPLDQLASLLETTPEELLHFLKAEEHWHILGDYKPSCPSVKYQAPNATVQRRAAEIKALVRKHFGDKLRQPGEPRFAFASRLSEVKPTPTKPLDRNSTRSDSPRIICSCLKIHGDPLMDSKIDMYPEGLLQRLADQGINGVWLYGVLEQLAPGGDEFPEFGEGYETRQANLRTLVERAKRYGIGVYLYVNEPRSQPDSFFVDRPNMAGPTAKPGERCMCTSNPTVRKWISDALANLFTGVPDLAGVITITASENPTNCAWRGEKKKNECPRCKNRELADIYAEVNTAIEAGIHRGNPDAKVLVWDWAWPDLNTNEIIAKLPKSVWLLSVSEWSLPLRRGGVKTRVNEYSMSAVGPGPRATANWAAAKKAGLKTAAKVQLNTTWELSSLPYLPVLDLVAEHCHNLASSGVEGMMASWTLGGYPSPNLRVAQLFAHHPSASVKEVLDKVARERYGLEGAASARRAWTMMSRAFQEYPFSQALVYRGPVQLGPANLLYGRRTGLRSTMVGFPFDDLRTWRKRYPPGVFASQFEKVATGWEKGVKELKKAVALAPADQKVEAEEELLFAQAAGLYFRSVTNQVRFIMIRDALAGGKLSPALQQQNRAMIRRLINDEINVASKMYDLTKWNSCVGYETASAYYYLPLDLVEKVINCRRILDDNALLIKD